MLGGKPPRRAGRYLRQKRERVRRDRPYAGMAVTALALFVLGVVGGFAWAADRELRGGMIRQRAEAAERPDWVHLSNVPPHVVEAFVAVVQPSLLRRGGVYPEDDAGNLARELVRQIHLLPDDLSGEARELVMAPVLEQRLSSTALVELYLNRVPLGQPMGVPVYGIFHASEEYFGKHPAELTLSEAATLAGLLLPPRIDDPKRQVGALGPRRNEVLQVMLRGGLITPEQYAAALAEPLGIQRGLDQIPFSRPADWGTEPEVIRLPPELRPLPDTLPPPDQS
jgi:membrane peptidoglycan carboxypeptidase